MAALILWILQEFFEKWVSFSEVNIKFLNHNKWRQWVECKIYIWREIMFNIFVSTEQIHFLGHSRNLLKNIYFRLRFFDNSKKLLLRKRFLYVDSKIKKILLLYSRVDHEICIHQRQNSNFQTWALQYSVAENKENSNHSNSQLLELRTANELRLYDPGFCVIRIFKIILAILPPLHGMNIFLVIIFDIEQLEG